MAQEDSIQGIEGLKQGGGSAKGLEAWGSQIAAQSAAPAAPAAGADQGQQDQTQIEATGKADIVKLSDEAKQMTSGAAQPAQTTPVVQGMTEGQQAQQTGDKKPEQV